MHTFKVLKFLVSQNTFLYLPTNVLLSGSNNGFPIVDNVTNIIKIIINILGLIMSLLYRNRIPFREEVIILKLIHYTGWTMTINCNIHFLRAALCHNSLLPYNVCVNTPSIRLWFTSKHFVYPTFTISTFII